MKAHITMRQGSEMTLELRRTVMDNELDALVWKQLIELAQMGEGLSCTLHVEQSSALHTQSLVLLLSPTGAASPPRR